MTNSAPKKFILSVKPDKYLSQGVSNCGLFSVKGILSAYGLDDKGDPREYHSNILSRFTSITWGMNYYNQILTSYGIDSKMDFAEKGSSEEKLCIVKELLSKNTPVMIRIGNGYFPSAKYSSFTAKFMPHWITLWGYDDEKEVFYVYDSGLQKKDWNKTLPIGNTTRSYKEIVKDWNFGKLQPWAWVVTGPHDFAYIAINGRKNGRN